jgi:nitronate monooxygenase
MWFDCLSHCGLRDGKAGWGLFCRGAGALPFGAQIRPVHDLMQWLLGGIIPPHWPRRWQYEA